MPTQKSGMPLDLDEYSDTNLRNMEDLSSNNRAGVSNSATRPAKCPGIKIDDSSISVCVETQDILKFQQELND